jgi:DNA-binding NarL/FixJ family response regulator
MKVTCNKKVGLTPIDRVGIGLDNKIVNNTPRTPVQNNAPINLLIIDDNKTFLFVVRNFLLRHLKHSRVETANRVRTALDMMDHYLPDLVLLDLDIPEIPGFEALPLIRQKSTSIPIIMLSMLDSKPYQDALLKAGANAFVSKNTMGDSLIPTIHRVMGLNMPSQAD